MKIIYFINKNTYLTKLCRARFIGIESLENVCDIKYWGKGWDNYNNYLSVQENVNNLKVKYDFVITYKPLELKEFNKLKIPKCIQYNEMWDVNKTLKEIKLSGVDLVVCHHLNDYQKYTKMNLSNIKFVYIGHCANNNIFKNYNLKKEYDILMAGAISIHYHLRNKFLNLLPLLKKKYRCHIHNHPGYDLKDAYTHKYQKEMATIVNKSRIFLTCSSNYKYRLGKYVEVPMCGTVICGDNPSDNADNYDFLINVDIKMSNQEIIDKISYYLDNEDKRLEKVNKGLEFSKNYTQFNYADRFLKELNIFLQNKFT